MYKTINNQQKQSRVKCSLCRSHGATKTTCPLNLNTKNPKPEKHPFSRSIIQSPPKVNTPVPQEQLNYEGLNPESPQYKFLSNYKKQLDDAKVRGMFYKKKFAIVRQLKQNYNITDNQIHNFI